MKDENVAVEVKYKEACGVEMEVLTSLELKREAKTEAIKKVTKEVEIQGFRKGKAPEALVLKNYPNSIEEESKRILANNAFAAAQKLVHIPVLRTDVGITYKQEGEKLIFSFEKMPDVPKIDPKNFKLAPFEMKEISEEEVEEALKQLRFFYAKWINIEDRPIREKDCITIDLDVLLPEGPKRIFTNTRFEVTDKAMAKWMRDLVMGAKAKDILEGVSFPDEHLSEEEKKNYSPQKVKVTVNSVEEAVLPEVNEELAKRVGTNSVEEMMKSIRNMLKKQVEKQKEKEKREEVQKFLLQYSFELPGSVLKNEIASRTSSLLNNEAFKRKWDKMNEKEKDQVKAQIDGEARNAVTLFYISKQIINDANISISNQEVEDRINLIKHPHEKREDLVSSAVIDLILIKAEDYILAESLKS